MYITIKAQISKKEGSRAFYCKATVRRDSFDACMKEITETLKRKLKEDEWLEQ